MTIEERKKLQQEYSLVLQKLNGLSEKTALYYADQATEEAMRIQISWYRKTQKLT